MSTSRPRPAPHLGSKLILPPVLLAVALGTTVGCSSKSRTGGTETDSTKGAPPPAGWSEKMQSLSKTLSDLLPLVASSSKFNDEKNRTRIDEDTKRLKSLAHSLKSGGTPNEDPSLRVMTGLFDEDIERALQSLQSGNREYARNILKDTTAYCIQCHTQTANGPDFPRLNLDINTSELNPLERAEFFAATRQFDRALESYTDVLGSDDLAKADPFEWERAARSALAIVVRVRKDPKAAQELIARIEKNKGLPQSTRKSLAYWKQSVKDWLKEKTPKLTTPADQIKHAQTLINRAQKNQEFPLDHSQDILYFRASSLLHDFLSDRSQNPELAAQGLYLAGMSAEATRDMNFWTLHETYYEMCIKTLPHSKQAQSCFARLQDSVTLGYSGSGGVRIPPEVGRRLEQFKELAQPQTDTQPSAPSDAKSDTKKDSKQ